MSDIIRLLESLNIEEGQLLQHVFNKGDSPLYYVSVMRQSPQDLWQYLSERVDLTHYYPLLTTDPSIYYRYVQHPPRTSVENILKLSKQINPLLWFNNKRVVVNKDTKHFTATWDESFDIDPLSIIGGIKTTEQEVGLVLIPNDKSWQIPAYLDFGNFNQSPSSEEHCAILRYWSTAYQAKVQALNWDAIELKVGLSRVSYLTASAIAKEHFAYCSSISNFFSFEERVAYIMHSTSWAFWWD